MKADGWFAAGKGKRPIGRAWTERSGEHLVVHIAVDRKAVERWLNVANDKRNAHDANDAVD